MQATPPAAPRVPLAVWTTRLAYTTFFVALTFVSLAAVGMAMFDLAHRDRMYPGVQAWGLDLSGRTPAETAVLISQAFAYPQTQAITFHDGARSWSATPAELGLTLNLPATVGTAYAVGRSGNPLVDWPAQFDAWYFGAQVGPAVVYDTSRTLAYLNQLAEQVFVPTVEASLRADGTRVFAEPGQVGRQLDVLASLAAVRGPLTRLETADVPLVFVEVPPLILDASAQAAAAESILRQPLILSVANPLPGDPGPWSIPPETLGGWLQIRRVTQADSAAFEFGLDPAALRAYLEPLAPALVREPKNARFIFNDETRLLEVIEKSADERSLDVEASLALIQSELARDVHLVPLVFQTRPPEVPDTLTAEQLNIRELVSQQSTYFRGSSLERIRNIEVAAARFHGLLVPPNAVFSFNEHLGDVSLDAGFAEALIIFGGRTIRGVGGGVCQVSTTVFRAAYFGGYPILERNSHAYRVGYYERGDPGQWSGPGLDATVFAPLVDFKFQNDHPAWLLMEVYVNASAGRITWKFYSTSDGRQVTVSPADVRNLVPAPEPLYEEDPQLAAGEIKQVDYAAEGADVTIYRVILRDSVQINLGEKPMTTHYQPWRAIYNYGPGTEGMPPAPTPTPGASPAPEATPTP